MTELEMLDQARDIYAYIFIIFKFYWILACRSNSYCYIINCNELLIPTKHIYQNILFHVFTAETMLLVADILKMSENHYWYGIYVRNCTRRHYHAACCLY